MNSFLFTMIVFFVQINQDQVVTCPKGYFDMGSENGSDDERPVHRVELASFQITKNEITEAQYDSCVNSKKCTPAHYDDNTCFSWNGSKFVHVSVPEQFRNKQYPVVCVTWHQAREYCRSKGMDLPTEAQWEYSAGAGRKESYAWGSNAPSLKNCTMAGSGHPSEVAKYPPNQWGLYDMTGNAWEWTTDYYESDHYSQSLQINPYGPDAGLYRVIRGGGWYSSAEQLRVTNRHWFSPDYAEVSIGFRCVKIVK